MSIATELNALRTNLNSAYAAVATAGGTVPSHKNSLNLATAIATIPQGYPNSLAYLAYDDVSRAQNYVNICNPTPLGSASHAFAASAVSAALTSLNLSRLTNFSNVVDTICMFENNTALATLTFPATVNFSKVASMSGMFRNCQALTSLNLNWTTSSDLLTLYNMFVGCSGLTSITFGSNWNTSGVQSFYGLFNSCSALANLTGFSNLSMASMTDMRAMFYNCANLTSIDFSSQTINPDFYVASSTANYALYGLTRCTSMNLTGLKSSGADLSNTHIFGNNPALTTLTFGGAHRIAAENTTYKLADALLNLIEVKSGNTITTLNMPNCTFFSTDGSETTAIGSVADIWGGSALTTANLSGWDVTAVDMTDNTADKMFTHSDNLTTLDLSGWTNPDGLNFGTMIGSDFIAANTYRSCAPNLTTLILNTPTVVAVNAGGSGMASSVNAFAGTPIAAGTGHIKVPSSLLSQYQAHSFWGRFSDSLEAIA